MPQKNSPASEFVGVRLPKNMKSELEEIARDRERSLSNLILVIVKDWLARQKEGQE